MEKLLENLLNELYDAESNILWIDKKLLDKLRTDWKSIYFNMTPSRNKIF